MDLHERISEGLEALRAGRPSDAAAALRIVWEDADLAAADDLVDIRARVGSLFAQAALESGQLTVADKACRDVLRILRKLGDRAGLEEVRTLQDQIVGALAREAEHAQRLIEQRAVASTPLAALLADVTDPLVRAEKLVKKATAHADLSELSDGAPLAHEALTLAESHGSTQWTVLARLALVRLEPGRAIEHLMAAHARAEQAGEFNLISTIARAAELAGVALPKHAGPHAEPA